MPADKRGLYVADKITPTLPLRAMVMLALAVADLAGLMVMNDPLEPMLVRTRAMESHQPAQFDALVEIRQYCVTTEQAVWGEARRACDGTVTLVVVKMKMGSKVQQR